MITRTLTFAVFGGLAAAVAFATLTPTTVQAAPIGPAAVLAEQVEADVVPVRDGWGRHRGYGHRHHGWGHRHHGWGHRHHRHHRHHGHGHRRGFYRY